MHAIHTTDHHDTTKSAIDNMIRVSNSRVQALIDISAFHSFISILFTNILGLQYETLDFALSVGAPLSKDCKLSYMSSFVRIEIEGQ